MTRQPPRGGLQGGAGEEGAGEMSQMLKLLCPWCEKRRLRVFEDSATGFYVGCSGPGFVSCPDTTGSFRTAQEAISAAKEYMAKYGENR
jgi:hypothetical protein